MGLFVFLVFGVLTLLGAGASPQYHERTRSPLCVRNNAPCAPDDSCSMVYYPANSSACADLAFESQKTPLTQLSLGSVDLKVYLFNERSYAQTAFNVSFSNATWTELKFRFMQNGNKGKNTCRQFIRSANSSVDAISYDCIWSDQRYESKPFIFDYEARVKDVVESARFLFNVPLAEELTPNIPKQHMRLLPYVEAIPTHLGRTIFNVLWSPLASEEDADCYRVYVFYNDSGAETVMHSKDVCKCGKKLCAYTTQMWYGSVRFGVQPIFGNGVEGYITKTQYFDLGGETARPLLLGIVSCSILVPIVLYLLLLLRNRLVQKGARTTPPNVLLVYSPTTSQHLQAVEALAHYLNTHCRVVAWMDELDIPNSSSKDPFAWCAAAVHTADVICVVASPYYSHMRSSSAVYQTDRLLLRLLREQYASGGKTRYCALLPPYATASDIPIEGRSLRKFSLPGDLDAFLQLTGFRWPMPGCLAPPIPGGQAQFADLGRDLSDCLKAAADDFRENRQRYVKQMQESKGEDAGVNRLKHQESVQSPSSETSWLPPFEEDQDKTKLLHTNLNAEKIFIERKKADKQKAEKVFADYPDNLDRLNLLGEKKQQRIVVVPFRSKVSQQFDLDALDL